MIARATLRAMRRIIDGSRVVAGHRIDVVDDMGDVSGDTLDHHPSVSLDTITDQPDSVDSDVRWEFCTLW
tara:strand:- start:22 stop:231 length:210 start_codon:yes stop_codon:yes gene_type:complete